MCSAAGAENAGGLRGRRRPRACPTKNRRLLRGFRPVVIQLPLDSGTEARG